MLEILLLIGLAKRIGSTMREKGRKGGWYQFLLIVFWFGGELTGLVVGGLLTGGRAGGLILYIFALLGAAAGAAIIFMIVDNLPSDTTDLQRQITRGSLRRCPHCGGATSPAAPVCEHCHRELPATFSTT